MTRKESLLAAARDAPCSATKPPNSALLLRCAASGAGACQAPARQIHRNNDARALGELAALPLAQTRSRRQGAPRLFAASSKLSCMNPSLLVTPSMAWICTAARALRARVSAPLRSNRKRSCATRQMPLSAPLRPVGTLRQLALGHAAAKGWGLCRGAWLAVARTRRCSRAGTCEHCAPAYNTTGYSPPPRCVRCSIAIWHAPCTCAAAAPVSLVSKPADVGTGRL